MHWIWEDLKAKPRGAAFIESGRVNSRRGCQSKQVLSKSWTRGVSS